MAQQIDAFLRQRSIEMIEVRHAQYLPDSWKSILQSGVSGVQLTGFALTLFGQHICDALGLSPTPEIVQALQERKVMSFAGLWIAGNIFSSALTASNALEIYKGSTKVWSTVEQGHFPSAEELVAACERVGFELIPPPM